MTELAGEVERRLQKLDVKGKTITLKLMIRSADAPRDTAKFMGNCQLYFHAVVYCLFTILESL